MKLAPTLTQVTPFSKFIALVLFALLPLMGFYLGISYQKNIDEYSRLKQDNNPIVEVELTPVPTIVEQKGCTLEAKICPDGTAVGRTGPDCEFAPCPPSS